MANSNSKKEIKNKLIYSIENSELNLRSRIDLKKEVKDNKITDMETLNKRMIEIEKNETSNSIEEHYHEEKTSPKGILESIVANSKLKKSYKNYYFKKIKNGEITDKNILKKRTEKDEKKLHLLSSLEKSNLKGYSKNEIKKQINNNTISDYKTLREEMKKKIEIEEMKKEKKGTNKIEINKRKLISKLNKLELDDFLKIVIEKEINKGEIKDEEGIYRRIKYMNRPKPLKIDKFPKSNKSSYNHDKPKNPFKEDYNYFKDLYG